MIVGVVLLDLRLFEVHTLKQKRSLVSRLQNRIRSRFPVSVAEVGNLDLLQRTTLGLCMVSNEESLMQSIFRNLEEDLYHSGQVGIINLDIEYVSYGEV